MRIFSRLACALINVRQIIRKRHARITPYGKRLYAVREKGEQTIIFCRLVRAWRYKRGVSHFVDALAREYNLGLIADSVKDKTGLFIDCGANVGELGLWARSHQMDYIAFEPEALEAECCDANNYGGGRKTHRKALWKEDGELEFFHKPGDADSTVFKIAEFDKTSTIEAVCLENALELDDTYAPIIFKVEAEGAEPEVLQGAGKLLAKIDYVAIDCGPERGLKKENTFVESHKILCQHGFEPIGANFPRAAFLYQNSQKGRRA